MATIRPLAQTTKDQKEIIVRGIDNSVQSEIWLKTALLDHDLLWRLVQLQVYTDSHDQLETIAKPEHDAASWFDVVILADEYATEPRIGGSGEELAWRSHSNHLDSDDANLFRHFGMVFNRRHDLFAALEVLVLAMSIHALSNVC
jgi:hypothetical protein